MEIPRQTKVVGAYLLCALVWGTTWFAIRVSIAPGGGDVRGLVAFFAHARMAATSVALACKADSGPSLFKFSRLGHRLCVLPVPGEASKRDDREYPRPH